MKVLAIAFKGKNNASFILVNKLKNYDKLYVSNSFTKAVEEFNNLDKSIYDYILLFGINKNLKNELVLERRAKLDKSVETEIDLLTLKKKLAPLKVSINTKAGNYLCNNLYYHALMYSKKCVFIHLPGISKIENLDLIVNIFDNLFA